MTDGTAIALATKARPNMRMVLLHCVAVGILVAGVVAFALDNLGNRYFWTDESSTFLTAMGWPGPGQDPGGLADIWPTTMKAFLDPGLFHLMVRWWSDAFGTSIVVLRLLPFTLFLIFLLSLLLLFRQVRAPWYVAAGGTSLILLTNITPYYAVELRPYAGGLAASVALPLMAIVLSRNPTGWRLSAYVVAFTLLASMQYNSVPVSIACAALLLAPAAYAQGRRRTLLIGAIALTLLWLPLVYVITRGNPLSSHQQSLEYMGPLVLRYQTLDQVAHTLLTNTVSFTALPRTAFLLIVPILWWRRWLPRSFKLDSSRGSLISLLWIYVASATAMAALLAVIGFLPWVLGTRWSITDIGFIAVSLVGLVGLALRAAWTSTRIGAVTLALVSVVACVVGAYRMATYHRQGDVDYLRALAPSLLAGGPEKAQVDYWIYPDARYWMEYSGDYPDLRADWIATGIKSTDGFKAAGAAEIEAFLASSDDRLLLRSQQALDDSGVALPSSVSVETVPPEMLNGVNPAEAPVLLVKN